MVSMSTYRIDPRVNEIILLINKEDNGLKWEQLEYYKKRIDAEKSRLFGRLEIMPVAIQEDLMHNIIPQLDRALEQIDTLINTTPYICKPQGICSANFSDLTNRLDSINRCK